MTARIKIGTRGSPLALAQANEVKAGLVRESGLAAEEFEIVVIKTSGDMIQDRLLLEEGGKGLFTKEIEEQLLSGGIDLAVHSTKDMPAHLPKGLEISAFLKREDPRDAFISATARTLQDLPKGAVVGTSSLRRQAQVLKLRPDLEIIPFRGNVQTRLRKMRGGEVAATLLAAAGLNRLGLESEITALFEFSEMIPAPGQGAIAVETRTGDNRIGALVNLLKHRETTVTVLAERAVALALGASCRMPLGAFARLDGETLTARAALFSPDGRKTWQAEKSGSHDQPEELGKALAKEIKTKADPVLLETYKVF